MNYFFNKKLAVTLFLFSILFTVFSFNQVSAKNVKPTEYIDNQKLPNEVSTVNGIPIVNKQNPVPVDYSGYKKLQSESNKALSAMVAEAKKDGVKIESFSGYRSISKQKSLYNDYVKKHGKKEADRFSARPNYSEHHLGLAHDMKDSTYTGDVFSDGAEKSKGIKWLHKNMYKYGFILRYPEGKENETGYIPEFWHIRYVGKEHAKAMKDENIAVLEKYLGMEEGEVIKGETTKKDAPVSKISKETSDSDTEKEETKSTDTSANTGGGNYKWFSPFQKEQFSNNVVTGTDKHESVLPSELSYSLDVSVKILRIVCAWVMSIITLILIIIISLQIASVVLINKGRTVPTKLEKFLFGDVVLGKDFWKVIIQNICITVMIMSFTLSMYFVIVQEKIYFGISALLNYLF